MINRRSILKILTCAPLGFGVDSVLTSCSQSPDDSTIVQHNDSSYLTLAIVLFEGFEILDVTGPLQLLSMIPEKINTILVGPSSGAVAGRAGHALVADYGYYDAPQADIMLVPGSRFSTFSQLENAEFISWIRTYATSTKYITSVCTGSAFLAEAGLLNGYSATTNKQAFLKIHDRYPQVKWDPHARWVEDKNRWTSSGVSAGIDMMAAFLAHIFGQDLVDNLLTEAELTCTKDSKNDPFAIPLESSDA